MWSSEPELRIRDSQVLIPRCMPQKEQNDRYNSIKRVIEKEVDIDNTITTLKWVDGEYVLREEESAILPLAAGYRRVRVDATLLTTIATPAGRLFSAWGPTWTLASELFRYRERTHPTSQSPGSGP